MQHDIVLKELIFDLLTPRVGEGGVSASKILTTMLLHMWFSFIIWYAKWPCSEKNHVLKKLNFDQLTLSQGRRRGGGLGLGVLTLTYWPHPQGREGRYSTKNKQEGQVALNRSPEFCLKLTYRYLLKAQGLCPCWHLGWGKFWPHWHYWTNLVEIH